MNYFSTRNTNKKIKFSQAIMNGLADDGGLYVPESFPKIDISKLNFNFEKDSYWELAKELIRPYAEGDILEDEIDDICKRAFNFPVILKYIDKSNLHAILELYHGPTFAFKDFGARFLAECMEAILKKNNEKKLILVATSGDTGSAVGSAFLNKENIEVKILFPKGMVSTRQKAQLCAFYGNVKTYEVDGTFDDCQRMVKEAFLDKNLSQKYNFSSANSINIARLIPQMTYYFYSSLKYFIENKSKPVIIVPTGNAGNVTAAYYAMMMGAPIKKMFLACNSNHSILDYVKTGEYKGHKTIKTLANAMDVGNPSNMERLMFLFDNLEEFRKNVEVECINDEKIEQSIVNYYNEYKEFICPHTACSVYCLNTLFKDENAIAVSTASAIKFSDVIEKILSKAPKDDEKFIKIINGEQRYESISSNYMDLFKD